MSGPTLAVDMTGVTTGGAPVNITLDIDGSAPLVLLPPTDPSGACFGHHCDHQLRHNHRHDGVQLLRAGIAAYPIDCGSTQAGSLEMSGDGHCWGVGMDARTLVDFTVAGALEGWEQAGSGRLHDNSLFSISSFRMTSTPEPALRGLFVTGAAGARNLAPDLKTP